ncbi:MAG: hypothetical protein KFF46_08930 [Desulfobacterales bacterium]|nr:hypothetical protein [Desulfobacterales bacterium]
MIVIEITDQEEMQMKAALLDEDGNEALRLIKELIRRSEQKKNAGMKSHLGG